MSDLEQDMDRLHSMITRVADNVMRRYQTPVRVTTHYPMPGNPNIKQMAVNITVSFDESAR